VEAVAVAVLWWGAVAWCERFLDEKRPRWAAACVSLLFASPVAAAVGWSGVGGQELKFDFDFLSGELTAATTCGAISSRGLRWGSCRSSCSPTSAAASGLPPAPAC
jgi:hypothetical protein